MTIFHIIDTLGVGGAQSMMFEIYYSINKYYKEIQQFCICCSRHRFNEEFVKSYGVPYEVIDEYKQIIKKIKKTKDPIVIYHKTSMSSFRLIQEVKKETRVKIIVVNHTLLETSSWRKCECIDRMVSVSEHMKGKASGWYPKIKHTCIRNGVLGERYDKIEKRKTDSDIFYTGRINRLCGWKHSPNWNKWCSVVHLPKRMVHEYIGGIRVGKHKDKKVMKGNNKVIMYGGLVDFKEKVSILKSWDVFLYEVNRNEGISVAILESLACGVPVVCSNHYGNIEVIKSGVNGYIFESKEKAAKILIDLCSNKEKLNNLKISTKKYFQENLDGKIMAEKYCNLIKELMGKRESENKIETIETVKKIEMIKEPELNMEKEKIIESSKKFSILTASYNKEKYLKDWASSILVQKYRPLEVVFVDDCSTDNTKDLIKDIENDFIKNNIEFKLIKNETRLFCGSSYKNTIMNATGNYFGVLDADDMLVEDAVEYIMNLYNKYKDIAWIYTQFLWNDENMKNGRKGFNVAPKKGRSLLDLGMKGIHGVGTGWRTFNYKIGKKEKIFEEKLTCAVDKYMCYRLEEMGKGLFIDRICYKHRGHPVGSIDSVSSTKDAIHMWKKVREEAKKRRIHYERKIYSITEEIVR